MGVTDSFLETHSFNDFCLHKLEEDIKTLKWGFTPHQAKCLAQGRQSLLCKAAYVRGWRSRGCWTPAELQDEDKEVSGWAVGAQKKEGSGKSWAAGVNLARRYFFLELNLRL